MARNRKNNAKNLKQFNAVRLNDMFLLLIPVGIGVIFLAVFLLKKLTREEIPSKLPPLVVEVAPPPSSKVQDSDGFPVGLPPGPMPPEIEALLLPDALKQAQSYENEGKLDLAVWCYYRMWKLDPKTPNVLFRLANIAFRLGQKKKGQELLEMSIARNEQNQSCYNMLGMYFMEQDDLRKAEEHFKLAIESDSSDPKGYLNLGEVLRKQGDTEKALEQLKTAVKLSPDSPLYTLKLNLALIDAGQAGDLATRAGLELTMQPDSTDWLFVTAALALKDNRAKDAATLLENIRKKAKPANFRFMLKDPAISRYQALEDIAPFYQAMMGKTIAQ